jgi:hypothetical protein
MPQAGLAIISPFISADLNLPLSLGKGATNPNMLRSAYAGAPDADGARFRSEFLEVKA